VSDRVAEIGALVEDRDDSSDDSNRAAVVNLPPVPADEWEAYDDTTVAEDNPEYDADADVIVVAFCDDLTDAHPDWSGDAPLTLPLECPTYAFPPGRLQRVGHFAETDTQPASGDDDATDDTRVDRNSEDKTDESDDSGGETADSPLTDAQAQLRDRLAESAEVTVETDNGAAVLVVEKLGAEHRIFPDGTVEGGPLADRLGDVAREYLGVETS
jgi:hypothetical protein